MTGVQTCALPIFEEEIDDSKSHEFKSHEFEFSYPSLALDPEGFIHLVYTWNQRRIKHIRFNYSWLIEDEPGPDGLKTANMRIMRSSRSEERRVGKEGRSRGSPSP